MASLILGIIGLCLLGIIWIPVIGFASFGPAVLALIFGIVAINQCNNDPNLEGKGMAIAGLVIGSIVVAIGLLVWSFIMAL